MRSPDRFFVDKEVPWLKKEVRSKCDDQESSSDDRRTLVRKLRKQKGYTYRNDLTTLRAPAAGGGVLAVAAGVLGGFPDSAAAGPPAPEAGGAAVDPPEERNRTDVSKIVSFDVSGCICNNCLLTQILSSCVFLSRSLPLRLLPLVMPLPLLIGWQPLISNSPKRNLIVSRRCATYKKNSPKRNLIVGR